MLNFKNKKYLLFFLIYWTTALNLTYFLVIRQPFAKANQYIFDEKKHAQDQIVFLESLTPKTVDLYVQIANLYISLGDKDHANQAIKSAQKLDPVRTDLKLF